MNGFSGIIGQNALITRLRAVTEFARRHGVPIEHTALLGPQGSGKRTIANALAEELGVGFRFAAAKYIQQKGDLTALLTALEPGELFFLADISQLRRPVCEILLPALKDFRIDLVIGKGPGQRIHPYKLNHFTCVCAGARPSDIPVEIRDSFGLVLSLEPYSLSELSQIAATYAKQVGLSTSVGAANLIAQESKGTPGQTSLLIDRLKKTGHKEIGYQDVVDFLDVYNNHNRATSLSAPGEADSLNKLSGVEFEELIADVLRKMGFRAETTRASGDGGIDIVAVLNKPIIGGRYLIQCKRFGAGNLVGAPLVREFYGALTADRKAVKGILITTSGFTDQARDFAQGLPLELIDAEGLRTLMQG